MDVGFDQGDEFIERESTAFDLVGEDHHEEVSQVVVFEKLIPHFKGTEFVKKFIPECFPLGLCCFQLVRFKI